ncbi:hypothetical protein LOTGIDRAFT_155120 [Lottia gigantea]|uniref:Uncharacterized protein n=1 Tax=Lottia gigantea TaxID=225164 RepID=V3ZSS8_LOTGI|nr:hypothetical protein LOTGIDRAFT_155120 [Lottia gigantea]ESO85630.1 hypothetical protein LOTGIDRAFT_155120 [Lottia gigantea]
MELDYDLADDDGIDERDIDVDNDKESIPDAKIRIDAGQSKDGSTSSVLSDRPRFPKRNVFTIWRTSHKPSDGWINLESTDMSIEDKNVYWKTARSSKAVQDVKRLERDFLEILKTTKHLSMQKKEQLKQQKLQGSFNFNFGDMMKIFICAGM